MSSATGSQAYMAVIAQNPATPREIPATPVLQLVNFVSDDMGTTISTKTSDHIRPDRMTSGVTTTGFEVGGGYVFESQFENSLADELLAGFLWAEDWIGVLSSESLELGEFLASDQLDLTGVLAPPTIIDGQVIKITGCTDPLNDGAYKLTTTGTNTYTVSPDFNSIETFALGVVANGAMIRNGKFYQPFFIERGHTDVDEYFKFLGMSCNVMTMELEDQSDVTGSYQFVGLTSIVETTVETGATYTPPTTNPVFSTVTNIPTISIDGVVQEGCFVKSLTLEVNNNVTPKTGLGVLGACETMAHRLSVTGALTMYFEDSAMYQRLLNGTPFSVSWTLEDANGNGYVYTLPKVILDSDTINVGGVDEDIMDDASYVAVADEVTNCMIQIDAYKA